MCGYPQFSFWISIAHDMIYLSHIIWKKILPISGDRPQVKQFGLPDATEQLNLFRLWLCENFNSPVVSEGTKHELSDIV